MESPVAEQIQSPTEIQTLNQRTDLKKLDYFLLQTLLRVESYANEAQIEIIDRVIEVADHSNQFDAVMVTGGSRKLSRSLLQAAGVSPQKFITLDSKANIRAYKEVDAETSALTIDDRIGHLRKILSNKYALGEEFSLCVVDDHVGTGKKANRFFRLLSRMKEISDYSFASFSAPGYSQTAEEMTGRPVSEQIEDIFDTADFVKKFYVPDSANSFFNEADYFFMDTSVVSSIISPGHPQYKDLSPEVILAAKKVLQRSLGQMYKEIQERSHLTVNS